MYNIGQIRLAFRGIYDDTYLISTPICSSIISNNRKCHRRDGGKGKSYITADILYASKKICRLTRRLPPRTARENDILSTALQANTRDLTLSEKQKTKTGGLALSMNVRAAQQRNLDLNLKSLMMFCRRHYLDI